MNVHGTVPEICFTYRGLEICLEEIPYSGVSDYDPGFARYPNGDPGEPPSYDLDVYADLTSQDVVGLVGEYLAATGRAVPNWVSTEASRILVVISNAVHDYVREQGVCTG